MIIDEYIDAFFYGIFPNYRRDKDGVFVKTSDDGEWIPVNDWKAGNFQIHPAVIRKMALHFFDKGTKAKGI